MKNTIKKTIRVFLLKRFLSWLSQLEKGRIHLTFPDGKSYNFGNPHNNLETTIKINNLEVISDAIINGDIGIAESFMESKWETDNLTNLLEIAILNPNFIQSNKSFFNILSRLYERFSHYRNKNTITNSKSNISAHYDIGNNFFETFLDKSMTYSCGIYYGSDCSLEEAQANKINAILDNLSISENDNVLDIGCGWGQLAITAASKYKCNVTAVTISQQQYDYVRSKIHDLNLDSNVEVLLKDYRQLDGNYDKIVSVEMIEAVGHDGLNDFFSVCDKVLNQNGSIAIQAITIPDNLYESYRKGSDFIRKHIFPGGHLPSLGAIDSALLKSTNLRINYLDNIGQHYATTLNHWKKRFVKNKHILNSLGYNEWFIRKWLYYFSYCEAAFKTGYLDDLQIILTRSAQNKPFHQNQL